MCAGCSSTFNSPNSVAASSVWPPLKVTPSAASAFSPPRDAAVFSESNSWCTALDAGSIHTRLPSCTSALIFVRLMRETRACTSESAITISVRAPASLFKQKLTASKRISHSVLLDTGVTSTTADSVRSAGTASVHRSELDTSSSSAAIEAAVPNEGCSPPADA